MSRSQKHKLIKRLEAFYGKDFKTPLARDLGVNISTIRRMFNQRVEIPLVYVHAIETILNKEAS